MDKILQAYIEERSTPEPNTGCWLWTLFICPSKPGSTQMRPGAATFRGKQDVPSRMAYRAYKGEPGAMMVCHKCDTPTCVNPDHLWLGTNAENMRDAGRKGRHASQVHRVVGERCHRAKLTEDNVKQIAALMGTVSAKEIAPVFGVKHPTIHSIWSGKNWSHVTGIKY